jgi:ribosomal protein S27AE
MIISIDINHVNESDTCDAPIAVEYESADEGWIMLTEVCPKCGESLAEWDSYFRLQLAKAYPEVKGLV